MVDCNFSLFQFWYNIFEYMICEDMSVRFRRRCVASIRMTAGSARVLRLGSRRSERTRSLPQCFKIDGGRIEVRNIRNIFPGGTAPVMITKNDSFYQVDVHGGTGSCTSLCMGR